MLKAPERTGTAVAPPTKTTFRPDIQGLRAIAVAAVVLYHSGVPFLSGGYVGVDVFFVISGFLITSHLLTGLRREGKVQFASFYARRARRILPASFVVLAASVVAALIWYPPLLAREIWTGAVATAFYVPNYLFAVEGTNYLAETTPSLFQHYWSLGIEEQFYLVWPVLLLLGFLFVKRPRKLFAVVLAIVVLSFAACVLLTFRNQPWAFFSLPTRAWELGVGGLAAFLLTYRPAVLRGPAAAITAWAGIFGIVAAVVLFDSSTAFPGYWAALPVVGTAAVIVGGGGRAAFGPAAALSTRPMLFVGAISYSLYLVHWPLQQIPQAAIGYENPLPLWVTLLLGAVSVPVAWLMFRFVEEPGRKGRWLAAARPRRSLLAAAAASALVAVAATGAYAYSTRIPLHTDQVAAPAEISTAPVATSFVPSNLQPSLRKVSSDQAQIYADGCHLDFAASTPKECIYGDPDAPRIVLFGDSHAAQWFPALLGYAEANGYAVESHTKSSCPSITAAIIRARVPYVECATWREAVIDRINREQPALVVLSNYGVAPLADSDDYGDAWSAGLSSTLDAITVPTAVIADTPNLRMTPSVCLSANLTNATECGRDRDVALDSPARQAEIDTTQQHDVPLIDLTDYLCDDSCEPILGNTLVYRDAHHLTATFSAQLADALGAELEQTIER